MTTPSLDGSVTVRAVPPPPAAAAAAVAGAGAAVAAVAAVIVSFGSDCAIWALGEEAEGEGTGEEAVTASFGVRLWW